MSFGAEHKCIVPRAHARVHAHTNARSSAGCSWLAHAARSCVPCAHTVHMLCVAGAGTAGAGTAGFPLDLTLTLTLTNPNPNQVLGQQGLPSTPLELRRCLFLCSTALHCTAAASRCACTHEHARARMHLHPCAPPHAPARPRTPPHAPARPRTPPQPRTYQLVLLAITAIAP